MHFLSAWKAEDKLKKAYKDPLRLLAITSLLSSPFYDMRE